MAVWFHLRDAFRSGDIWVPHSRCYSDLKQVLVPAEAVKDIPRLAVPLHPEAGLADRKAYVIDGLSQLAKAARAGAIPGGSIENGIMKFDRLPTIRITELTQDVDADIGFTETFISAQTGAPCKDQISMLTVLLTEGLNLGLSKMAKATDTHDYFQLSRLSRWHVESDANNQALIMVIEAQSRLPMARFCGRGMKASSDGRFLPAARQSKGMNLVNAKYGSGPGLKAYTHVSDL